MIERFKSTEFIELAEIIATLKGKNKLEDPDGHKEEVDKFIG